MEELNSGIKRTHKLMVTNRRNCTLSGILEVVSFDIHEILLETEQGKLKIVGDDLHVNRLMLDKGEVDIDGKIDSFVYSDNKNAGEKTKNSLAKLFR